MVIALWAICAVAAMVLILIAVNVATWPAATRRVPSDAAQISILIPARNEAGRIQPCLDSAIGQGPVVGEILVYDDYSVDATADIVRVYARRDSRVRLITPFPLPADWCGKNHACSRLAHNARCPWLLFLDADTRLHPDTALIALSEAKARGGTLLSLWPGLELNSFWERVLMPLLHFVVFSLFPAPLSFRRRDSSLGLAHGACLLAHRSTYFAIGGHGAVRAEVFEDTRLARVWRERGEWSFCLDGQHLVRVRMYDSFGEIWSGFQKNIFTAFRHTGSFTAFIGFHFAVFFLPFLLVPTALVLPNLAAPIGLAAAFVIGSRLLLARRFAQPWWTAIFHPVAEAVLVCLGISSWWRCFRGRGVEWKGRSYHRRDTVSSQP